MCNPAIQNIQTLITSKKKTCGGDKNDITSSARQNTESHMVSLVSQQTSVSTETFSDKISEPRVEMEAQIQGNTESEKHTWANKNKPHGAEGVSGISHHHNESAKEVRKRMSSGQINNKAQEEEKHIQ